MLDNFTNHLTWAIAARETKDFFQARKLVDFLWQGSRAVQDPDVKTFLSGVAQGIDLGDVISQVQHLDLFVNEMLPWLQAHSTNKILGLDQFQADYSAGTTQSFESFYWRHRQRRMRCLVGEYFYHLKAWISTGTNWQFLTEQSPLQMGDALVLSAPFCDTGDMPRDYHEILARCEKLSIPVLIDACYYPISHDVTLDLNYACIDTVSFSLSKAFPVANLRIGVRYIRSDVFDGQKLLDSINYNNVFSAYVGRKLLQRFGSDYIDNVYRNRQLQACKKLNLRASNCVLFAVGDDAWSKYNRKNLLQTYKLNFDAAMFANRISLVALFDNWNIFEAIKNAAST